jgi:hypothetical protein
MIEGQLKIFCGATGSGKTMEAMKETLNYKCLLVYDFQNQWHTITQIDNGKEEIVSGAGCRLIRFFKELSKSRLRVSPENFSINDYIHIMKHVKGFTFVMEESTGLFPGGRIPQELIKQALSKRHTGNNFIFVFHAINRIPIQLIEFIDELYLFRTNDLESKVKSKIPGTFDKWQNIRKEAEKNPFYFEKILPPL